MSADIINLNKVRKARELAEQQKRAIENRAKFGRSKAEKTDATRTQDKLDGALDGAAREPARLDDAHDDLDPGNVS